MIIDKINIAFNKTYILTWLMIMLVAFGCEFKRELKNNNEVFSRFDDNYVDHFRSDFGTLFLKVDYFPSKAIPNSGAYSRRVYELSEWEVNKIIDLYQLDKIRPVSHEKYDCFVCSYHKENPTYSLDCELDSVPIPDFKYLRRRLKTNEDFLPSDFDIYPLKAEMGNFLHAELLRKDECDLWIHGYSKGLALSRTKRLLVYWVELW